MAERSLKRRDSRKNGQQSTRRRRLNCQRLEPRLMLAGDVEIFSRAGDLFVYGDRGDNAVEIRLESSGDLVAEGLDGTTVNGSSDPLTILEGGFIEDDLKISLGRGDDVILLDGVEIADDLWVNGGSGDDSIGLLRTFVGDDASIHGSRGDLQFSLDLSTIDDDLRVYGHRGDDVIVFDESFVGDDTRVVTSWGDDTIIVRASTHQDDVFLSTGGGDDLIAVLDTEIGDDVTVFTGWNEDSLVIRDSSIGDRVLAVGGFGHDALALEGEVELNPARTPFLFGFEKDMVADTDAAVDAAIAELVASGARRPTLVDIAAGDENFSVLVGLLVQAGLLDAVSGSDPLTVFAPTNDAFAAFIEEFSLSINEDGTLDVPTELLTSVLTFHVAAGNVDSGTVLQLQPIPTLQGESIDVALVGGEVVLDQRAGLVAIDIRARNGIIHVIDTVLTPSLLDVA